MKFSSAGPFRRPASPRSCDGAKRIGVAYLRDRVARGFAAFRSSGPDVVGLDLERIKGLGPVSRSPTSTLGRTSLRPIAQEPAVVTLLTSISALVSGTSPAG